MDSSSEFDQAMSKLSQLANEEANSDEIPKHLISKIASEENTKNPNLRAENFSKERSFKIENQKRLKFLEEFSEIRDKPHINSSFNSKVRDT